MKKGKKVEKEDGDANLNDYKTTRAPATMHSISSISSFQTEHVNINQMRWEEMRDEQWMASPRTFT